MPYKLVFRVMPDNRNRAATRVAYVLIGNRKLSPGESVVINDATWAAYRDRLQHYIGLGCLSATRLGAAQEVGITRDNAPDLGPVEMGVPEAQEVPTDDGATLQDGPTQLPLTAASDIGVEAVVTGGEAVEGAQEAHVPDPVPDTPEAAPVQAPEPVPPAGDVPDPTPAVDDVVGAPGVAEAPAKAPVKATKAPARAPKKATK